MSVILTATDKILSGASCTVCVFSTTTGSRFSVGIECLLQTRVLPTPVSEESEGKKSARTKTQNFAIAALSETNSCGKNISDVQVRAEATFVEV